MFLADIYGTKEGEEDKDDRQTLQAYNTHCFIDNLDMAWWISLIADDNLEMPTRDLDHLSKVNLIT